MSVSRLESVAARHDRLGAVGSKSAGDNMVYVYTAWCDEG